MVNMNYAEIEKVIQDIESNSSAEVVVSIQKASAEYGWCHWIWGSVTSLLASILLLMVTRDSGWNTRISDLIQWQCLGFFLGSVAPYLPSIKRWTLPESYRVQATERAAMIEFFRQNLTHTRRRTGILVYISLLERRIEILADRGIVESFSTSEQFHAFVRERADAMAAGFQTRSPVESICSELKTFGAHLAKHLPAERGDNPDELPNSIT
jgi:putative membrane protein